jgi:hypothetical protein
VDRITRWRVGPHDAHCLAAEPIMDDIFYPAVTLVTLLSLFILGPALGRAFLTRVDGSQDWSVPTQHLALGVFTMIVVAGMIVLYGALWKLSPKSVAWYTWIEEMPMKGSVGITGPVDIRQPSRGK